MSLKQWFADILADEGIDRTQIDLAPRPKPRLVAVTHAPSRDEFRAWRDDSTTQFVFAALRAAQANQKTAWDEMAWVGGVADELALVEYRTRADAYAGLEQADYEAFCEWAGVDPEPEEPSDE
jgi:hypothetical protein